MNLTESITANCRDGKCDACWGCPHHCHGWSKAMPENFRDLVAASRQGDAEPEEAS